MNTHETYISNKLATQLKQAGFDWRVLYYYDNEGKLTYGNVYCNWNGEKDYTSCPPVSVVCDWLREIKNYHVYAGYRKLYTKGSDFMMTCQDRWIPYIDNIGDTPSISQSEEPEEYNTYYEAILAGINMILTKLNEE